MNAAEDLIERRAKIEDMERERIRSVRRRIVPCTRTPWANLDIFQARATRIAVNLRRESSEQARSIARILNERLTVIGKR